MTNKPSDAEIVGMFLISIAIVIFIVFGIYLGIQGKLQGHMFIIILWAAFALIYSLIKNDKNRR